MAKTTKIRLCGVLKAVRVHGKGFECRLEQAYSVGPYAAASPGASWEGRKRVFFTLSRIKGLAVANGEEEFPLGKTIKVSGRVSSVYKTPMRLTHVKVLAVDGLELTAWSQRVGSVQEVPGIQGLAEAHIKEAEEAEAAMRERSSPEMLGAITDPTAAYITAMQIVRRQRKLKEPKLSPQEIWHLRDTLNLLAEKLNIAGA